MIKYNNLKYQLKNGYKRLYLNYNPYLYIYKNKYIKDKNYKSLLLSLMYYIPKSKLIYNKIYNITEKKNLRMGKGKGKISYLSTYYYGNKPIWINNNIKYNKFKRLYLKYVFKNISKKYLFIDFK